MGDIADMMLDGTLCEGCGEYLGDGNGYVRYCLSCTEDMPKPQQKTKNKIACPHCGKWVKKKSLDMHIEAKH